MLRKEMSTQEISNLLSQVMKLPEDSPLNTILSYYESECYCNTWHCICDELQQENEHFPDDYDLDPLEW